MKYAYNAQGCIRGLHFTRMQTHFELPLIGEDEKKDKRLWASVYRFFEWDYETQEKSKENGDNEFYKWLLEDDQAETDREKYYLLSYWRTADPKERFGIAEQYQMYFKKRIISLDAQSIKELYSTYKKRCRREVREFRESKARLIYLDLESFTPFLKWVSLCFVIGGYAYANILYGHFSIPLGQFFSIGDYLALSLDQIQPLVLAIAGYLAMAVYEHRNYTTQTKFERVEEFDSVRISAAIGKWSFAGILLMHIAGPHITTKWSVPGLFPPEFLAVAVFFLAIGPVASVSSKYFKNNEHVTHILLFLITFGACLYFSAEQKIKEVKAGWSEVNFEIVVQSRNFTEKNSAYIGSNSQYLFLKTAQDKVEIFRLSQVDRISFKKEFN